MKTIDTYFKTENEYWNEFIFDVYNKAVKSGLFTDNETPVKLFNEAINVIYEHGKTPVKAVNEGLKMLGATPEPEQLFVLEQISHYFKHTEFDGEVLTEIHSLLQSYILRMRPKKPEAANLRETLKGIVMDELEALPKTIKELEPQQRLNIVCKLMPFVLPKVETVHFEQGEPNEWSL